MAHLSDRDYKPTLDAFFVQPDILVAHHIESYNSFINYDIKRIAKQYDNYTINIERNTETATDDTKRVKYIKVVLHIHDITLQRPRYNDSTNKERVMFPNMTRNQGLTYQSQLDVNMSYDVTLMDAGRQVINIFHNEAKSERLGYIPVMLKSNLCNLHDFSKYQLQEANEDPYDYGGYFIVKGTEKYIVPQEKRLENYVFMFKNEKVDGDFSIVAEIKSVRDDITLYRSSTVKIKYVRKTDEIVIAINPGFANKDIPITIMFRALGIETDREIVEYCIGDMKDLQLLEMMRPSLLWGKKERSGAETRYQTRDDALLFLALGYLQNENILRDKPIEAKQKYIMGTINKYLFPHIIDTNEENLPVKIRKAKYLGFIVRNVLLAKIGQIPNDDRDDLGNKRIDLSGPLLAQIFRFAFSSSLDKIKTNIMKEFQSKVPQNNEMIKGLIERNKNENTMMSPFKSSLSTGLWKTGASKLNTRNGVSQILQRKSRIDTFSNLRKVYTPSGSGQIKLSEIRRLHTSQYGYIDPLETPDGAQTGVVKHMAGTCHISLYSDPVIVFEMIETLGENQIIKVEELDIRESWKLTPILINGDWKYSTTEPKEVSDFLRKSRRELKLEKYTEIVWNIDANEIRVMTDSGRCLRPLMIVGEGNKLLFNADHLKKLTAKNPFDRWNWDDLFSHGLLEYIGTHECEYNCIIAMYPSVVYKADKKLNRFSHCEIHPICMLGGVTGLIPFSSHNQGPRNLFQGSMAKQSIDIYSTAFSIRMDTVSHVLHYPQRPLCTTYMADAVDFNTLPAGMNAMVAIAMYSGYNQEDSVILNKSSVDRGLFNSSTFKTYKEEAKNDEKFIKPEEANTSGMGSQSNYDKLNMYGIVPVGQHVYKDDILIGKVASLDRAERTGQIDQKDISVPMKEEYGIVDRIITDTNDDGYEIYKVKIRILKIPQIGDKFSCLTDDHEVLTLNDGWKSINKITLEDQVATLRDGKYIEYNKPIKTFEYDVDGDMYHIKNQQIDLMTTLNHKMYVRRRNRRNYELIEAKNLIGQRLEYKKDGVNNNLDQEYFEPLGVKMDAWLIFFGIWISEGWATYNRKNNRNKRTVFATNKQRVKDALDSVSKELKVHFVKNKDHKWDVYKINFYNYLLPLSVGSVNKQLPEWAFKLSIRQSKLLIDGIILGDGNITKLNVVKYSSSSKKLINDFQRLCFNSGWSANFNISRRAGTTSVIRNQIVTRTADNYCASIIKKKLTPEVNSAFTQDEIIHFKGKVYCIEVPNHVFYVRRNSKCCWTGNSRSGQKGICGMMYNQSQMPFTSSGMTPDLIMNPQAIPSRMTIGQLMEVVTGKGSAMNGTIADATPFTGIMVETIVQALKEQGFEEMGTEQMYSGFTGKKLETRIFFGPTYYQRLKHMVAEKMHGRASGRVQMLTRQPLEGRAREGGLRFGEMERDAIIGHGASQFLKERFFECSDKYEMYICDTCGYIAVGNDNKTLYRCLACRAEGRQSRISKIMIPYASKLLIQEIISMGISVRTFPERYIAS